MLAPLGQAIDALSAEISGLLTNAGAPLSPEVRVLTNTPRLAGIGGFVGLHDSPRAEIFARRLDAELAVRVFADNAADLIDFEMQAVRDLITADPALLRRNGIQALKRRTDKDTPVLLTADGIAAPFGRDVLFEVRYEHMPLPDAPEGVLGELPLDATTAGLSARGGLLFDSDFATDPLADFQALDRVGGSGTAGNWAYDAGAQEVTQTGTTSRGSNGLRGNKAGTYLILNPSSGGDVENFVVNAEMRCGATGSIGFVFRFIDVENFGFVVLEEPASVRVMGKRISGTGTLLDVGGQSETAGYVPDAWMRVRFIADGDRFELAIDEEIVLTGRDPALAQSGSVGLFCRRANTARFRHFRLSSL